MNFSNIVFSFISARGWKLFLI